jgi:hypothetical protein
MATVCSFGDCGERHYAKGFCNKHWARWKKHGDPSVVKTSRRHGHALTATNLSPEYRSWRAMKSRCLRPKAENYKDYGGRGIKIHEPWIGSFETFLRDLGLKPMPGMTLERVDNDGNYEPGNVVWATRKTQARNRRAARRA